jgi:hypothetical protein
VEAVACDIRLAARAINAEASRLGERLASEPPWPYEPWEDVVYAIHAMWRETAMLTPRRRKHRRESGLDFSEAREMQLIEQLLAEDAELLAA